MKYTDRMEDALFLELDSDSYDKEFLAVFNPVSQFVRSFSTGLRELIQAKSEEPVENYFVSFKKACRENDVPLATFGSINTLKAWLGSDTKDDFRPRHNEENRRKLFAFSFAIKLTVEETKHLFHKVYLDRAFNQRSYEELIYYFCLQKGSTYRTAKELIGKVDISLAQSDDYTIPTRLIADTLSRFETSDELLNYIFTHGHNFQIGTQSAINVRNQLIRRALQEAKKNYKEYGMLDSGQVFLKSDKDESASALYATIVGYRNSQNSNKLRNLQKDGKKSVTKEITFKRDVSHRLLFCNFPKVKSLYDWNGSFDELRKTIILLFSYFFWNKSAREEKENIYDEFVSQLNDCLQSADLPSLYARNPYDWLFLYCSTKEDPLLVFQEILESFMKEEQFYQPKEEV